MRPDFRKRIGKLQKLMKKNNLDLVKRFEKNKVANEFVQVYKKILKENTK